MRNAYFKKSKPKNEVKIRFEEMSFRIARIWRGFHKKYPDADSCWKDIANTMVSQRLAKCGRCRKRDFRLTTNVKVIQCCGCGQKVSVSAGTFFHRVRKIRVWMAAIWLLQHGESVSSTFFAFICEIAQSSALHILKSVFVVTAGVQSAARCRVSSKHFMGWFLRRSSETPRREPPFHEEKAFRDDELKRLEKENSISGAAERELELKSLGAVELKIFELLIPGPLGAEQIARHTGLGPSELLSKLTLLELIGILRPFPGGLVGLCPGALEKVYGEETNALESATVVVKNSCRNKSCVACSSEERAQSLSRLQSNFGMFGFNTFQGCSRKHFQYYLYAFAYTESARACIDRSRDEVDGLLTMCLRRGYVGSHYLYASVTPLLVPAPLDEPCK